MGESDVASLSLAAAVEAAQATPDLARTRLGKVYMCY